MRNLVLILVCSLFTLSCNSDEPIQTDGAMMPVVTGLRVTYYSGPKQEYQWGEPLYPNVDGISRGPVPIPEPVREFLVYNPYPNPAKRNLSIKIASPKSVHVRCWLSPASFMGVDNLTQGMQSTLYQPPTTIQLELVNKDLVAGTHVFTLDRAQVEVPHGLYRVYVQFDNNLQWRDVWLFDELEELPEPLYGTAIRER